ncbi:MAG TPA: alcohol dehydrogenase catalytic domain-containing protein [Chloroflexota bacterium]
MSGAATIRQVVLGPPGHIEVVTANAPQPGSGEVRIRTSVVGVCGTDVHALAGKHPFIDLPVVPGHETVGIIDAVGSEVSGFESGQRVLLEPNLVCGECRYCQSGRYNLCERLAVVGCQTPGAMAELFIVPASRLHHVPASMTDTEASLVEPLSTATHAVRMAGGDLSGLTVAILGAGTIGLLTLIAAREAQAAAIAVTDMYESKIQRALRLGARAGFDAGDEHVVERIKEALGGRPDVIFDCVSSQSSITQAIALAGKGGTIVVIGIATGPVQIPLALIQDQEIRLEGSAMYVKQDVERAMELMQSGAVPVDEIVTAVYPLEQAPEAFAAAREGDQVKVQLRVNGD